MYNEGLTPVADEVIGKGAGDESVAEAWWWWRWRGMETWHAACIPMSANTPHIPAGLWLETEWGWLQGGTRPPAQPCMDRVAGGVAEGLGRHKSIAFEWCGAVCNT